MMSKGLQVSLSLIAIILLHCSCSKTKSKPELLYTPNMTISPALKAQELDSKDLRYTANRIPVPGTVPRDYEPYPYATAATVGTAKELVNPLMPSLEVLKTGQKYFNIFYESSVNFEKACNLGASHADGDILLFLNNDTEI